jgi:LysR family transcriptional regulator, transcriptional activator for dmlA
MGTLSSRGLADQSTIRHCTVAALELMQIDRSDLALLSAIQREGSLAGAARSLDLAAPVASKRLAALEQRVGARLLHRTTRRLQLTAEGETFVAQAAPLLDGFARLEESLAERATQASGRLRVASSLGFGRVWLAPALAQLHALHPGIEVDLHLTEQLPDLTTGRFDAAVWLWRPQGASLVTRRLASNRRIVIAAPSYLKRHGAPQTPDDLLAHRCLVVREHDDSPALWRLQSVIARSSAARTLRVSGPMASNHGEVVRDWALAGHGLMLRSLWDVYPLLQRGQLVHVLPDWAMLDADVHLVLPPRDLRLATPRRLRLLQEHLVAAFADVPWNVSLPARGPRAPRPQR